MSLKGLMIAAFAAGMILAAAISLENILVVIIGIFRHNLNHTEYRLDVVEAAAFLCLSNLFFGLAAKAYEEYKGG